MELSITVLFALFVQLLASPVDIFRKNVSCAEIKTSDGFKYKYDYPGGADISVYHNKTKIGSLDNGKQPMHSTEVIRLDNSSVITEKCGDLQIQVLKYQARVIEYWLYFLVAVPVNTTKPDPEPSNDYNRKLSIYVGAVGAVGAVCLILLSVLSCCYMSWKKKMKRQQKAATCSEYFRYLWTRYAIKKQRAESSEPGETRQLRGREILEASATTEVQQNGISLVEYVSATDLCGSGENGVEQDSSHGSMHVVSKELNTPDVDRASPHGDMNSVRNMRDDPGGNKGCVGVDIPDSDMIAEAEPLVNKSSFGQDQVGRSFATPGTDVESKPRVKNFRNY